MGYVITRFTARDNDLGPAGEFLFSMIQSIPDLDTGVTNTCMCNSTCSYLDCFRLHILRLISILGISLFYMNCHWLRILDFNL